MLTQLHRAQDDVFSPTDEKSQILIFNQLFLCDMVKLRFKKLNLENVSHFSTIFACKMTKINNGSEQLVFFFVGGFSSTSYHRTSVLNMLSYGLWSFTACDFVHILSALLC